MEERFSISKSFLKLLMDGLQNGWVRAGAPTYTRGSIFVNTTLDIIDEAFNDHDTGLDGFFEVNHMFSHIVQADKGDLIEVFFVSYPQDFLLRSVAVTSHVGEQSMRLTCSMAPKTLFIFHTFLSTSKKRPSRMRSNKTRGS